MKKTILAMTICFCAAVNSSAQSILDNISRSAKSITKTSVEMKASRSIYEGVDNVLSGRIFGKKKDTSKGTNDALVSYINSKYGFKGQYPNGYSRADDEDGSVSFTSADGNIGVIFMGCEAAMSIDEEYQSALDQINAEFELLESSKKSDGYFVKYNMGGTCAAVRVYRKDNREATVMVSYPEAEATAYKKLVSNLTNGVKFIR